MHVPSSEDRWFIIAARAWVRLNETVCRGVLKPDIWSLTFFMLQGKGSPRDGCLWDLLVGCQLGSRRRWTRWYSAVRLVQFDEVWPWTLTYRVLNCDELLVVFTFGCMVSLFLSMSVALEHRVAFLQGLCKGHLCLATYACCVMVAF